MSITQVDTLNPNTFEVTGVTKSIYDAWREGDWLGSFNLWVLQSYDGTGAILYQQRCFSARWAPGLLDVSAGGHYHAGETISAGLREVQEELGKTYRFEDLTYLGKKLYLRDEPDRRLRYAVDVFIVVDDSPLSSYDLERDELEGLYICPITELMKVHQDPRYTFTAEGIRYDGGIIVSGSLPVSSASFPYNWDNYHFKMCLLAQQFLRGESPIVY